MLRALAGLLVVSSVTLLAGAQGQKPPVFRATTNIVQTDVTVLDRNNRPVKGLTIDDFELYEDGKKVEVLGFAEVSIPDAVDAPAWMRETSPDVTNALNGRVLLFLLDDAQMPYLMESEAGFIHPNERIAAVKRIAEQFINRMGPEDMAAVICVYDNRCDLDFTGDRARIRAAIDKFTPKGASGGGMPSPAKVSANMAESIAKYLIGQNSRRRALVYITQSEPVRPEIWSATSQPGTNATIQMVHTFRAAIKAGITVYSVNPTSLLSLKDAPPDDPDAPESDIVVPFRSRPRSLSAETGGFNISRPAEFVAGVTQIFRETGSYYLLGFEPPPKKDTGYNMIGGLREIEVRVARPDLTIKTKRGYVAPETPKTPKDPPAASSSALAGVLPKTDLPLRVNAVPFAIPGKSEALVVVVVGVEQPSGGARVRDYIDVQVRAFTQQGDQRAATRNRVDALIASSRSGRSLTEVVSELRLKPGVYQIRASAYSERMGDSGSVYAAIEIPDFARMPVSLSGILLMSLPKPESITPVPLSMTLPVVPTTEREFARGALVRGSARVYQGGKLAPADVRLRTTILDPKGATVVDRSETLAGDRFGADRSTDVRIDVPIASLSAGQHRLRIEAGSGGQLTLRDVVFTVR